jgi:V/A-type H+/Na+-transporting ATPase subunit E
MPIKDIKDKIIEDARNEKEKIIKEAQEKIENMKNQAQKESNAIKNQIMERYKQEANLKEKKIITEARLEAKKDILSEKQAFIDKIFQEAMKRIEKLDDREYAKLMEKLILENVEHGDEEIYIGNQERKLINQDFLNGINKKIKDQGKKGELKFSKKHLPIKGGIIIGTDEIRKNASLEILLEKIKEDIETRLNQFLFQKNEELNA